MWKIYDNEDRKSNTVVVCNLLVSDVSFPIGLQFYAQNGDHSLRKDKLSCCSEVLVFFN